MDKSTITLLLGLTLGLTIVTVTVSFILLSARAQTATLAIPMAQTYNNEEKWDVVKDQNGRVKTIVVHREATTG